MCLWYFLGRAVGGNSRRVGSGRNKGKIMQQCIIFSIKKRLKGGSQEKRGVSKEFKIWEVRGLDPPAPPPPPSGTDAVISLPVTSTY